MDYDYTKISGIPSCNRRIVSGTNPQLETRESLKINLNHQGDKIATIIMMNPSKADSYKSDRTVNNIVDFFSNRTIRVLNERRRKIDDIKFIHIVNLFPIYNPQSNDLYKNIDQIINQLTIDGYLKIMNSNIEAIKEAITESKYIVFGWGNHPNEFQHLVLYYKQIVETLKLINILNKNGLFLFRIFSKRHKKRFHLTEHKNPSHPTNGEIRKLVRVDIDQLNRIIQRNL